MHKPQKLSRFVGIFLTLFVVSLTTPGFSQQEGLNFISEVRERLKLSQMDGETTKELMGVNSSILQISYDWDKVRRR